MLLAALIYAAQAQWTPVGYWANRRQSIVVSIKPCGEALCGTVISATEKARSDARRGGTPELIGVELIHEFIPDGQGSWNGNLFIPDLNKKSKAQIVRLDDDHVRVRGCVVGRLMCRTQVWTRANADWSEEPAAQK